MKVIFMGTPAFAVPTLEMLLEHHEVLAVVTQPDRPKGRGKKLVAPPVKEAALEHGLPVLQPLKMKEEAFLEALRAFNAEVIIVVAYGRILPEEILNMPPRGCINVHGSLLPAYRGAAPIQWAVIDGKRETGVTTMYMAKGLDCGDMLLKSSVLIGEEETYGELYDRLSKIGAQTLFETLELMEKDGLRPEKQDDSLASYAPMITKDTEHIDWTKSAAEIKNLIRGLSPQPGAYTEMNGEKLKLWKADVMNYVDKNAVCGEITEVGKKSFTVQCAGGSLVIEEMQTTGGKRMDTGSYMRGHEIKKGTVLS